VKRGRDLSFAGTQKKKIRRRKKKGKKAILPCPPKEKKRGPAPLSRKGPFRAGGGAKKEGKKKKINDPKGGKNTRPELGLNHQLKKRYKEWGNRPSFGIGKKREKGDAPSF